MRKMGVMKKGMEDVMMETEEVTRVTKGRRCTVDRPILKAVVKRLRLLSQARRIMFVDRHKPIFIIFLCKY